MTDSENVESMGWWFNHAYKVSPVIQGGQLRPGCQMSVVIASSDELPELILYLLMTVDTQNPDFEALSQPFEMDLVANCDLPDFELTAVGPDSAVKTYAAYFGGRIKEVLLVLMPEEDTLEVSIQMQDGSFYNGAFDYAGSEHFFTL